MAAFGFHPFPNIATDRLLLRQLATQDDNDIFFLRSDERVLQYLSIKKAETIDDARAFIAKINKGITDNEWIYWAITLKGEERLIGTICLWNILPEERKAEIGYALHPDLQGRGLMLEAVTSVLSYGFEKMNLQMIEAFFHPDNLRSVALLKKSGFTFNKTENDMVVYTIKNPISGE